MYIVSIVLSTKSKNWERDGLYHHLGEGTNLSVTERKQVLKGLEQGQKQCIRPIIDQIDHLQHYLEKLNQTGVQAHPDLIAVSMDLPYLLDNNMRFIKTMQRTTVELKTKADVEMYLTASRLFATGYGMNVQSVAEKDKWLFWKTQFSAHYQDGCDVRPIYSGQLWITEEQEQLIVLWSSH
jgi:DNA-binding protein Fis